MAVRERGEQFQSAAEDLGKFAEGALMLGGMFIPELRDVFSSEWLQNLQARNIGRETTRILREARPDLQPAPSGAQLGFRTPTGVMTADPRGTAEQGVAERFQTFEQLQEWQREQVGEISDFRMATGNAMLGLQEADNVLRRAGLGANIQLRQGMQELNQMRQNTLRFIGAGLALTQRRLDEIRAGNEDVLESIDTEIEGRMNALVTGTRAQTEATFRQHERMIDSQSHMDPGERRALRMMYEAMANSDIALGAGTLHEEAVEFRGGIAKDLQVSENTARSYAASTAGGLMISGVQAFAQAEEISAGLRKNHANNLKDLAIARQELKQFAATYTESTGTTLWNMVNDTVRPVLVFSDIMQDMFDVIFDANAYNNTMLQQGFQNEIVIERPAQEAALHAVNWARQSRMFEEQMEASHSATEEGLVGDFVQGGLTLTGGLVGGPPGAMAANAATSAARRGLTVGRPGP
jgi:hypothetical protein